MLLAHAGLMDVPFSPKACSGAGPPPLGAARVRSRHPGLLAGLFSCAMLLLAACHAPISATKTAPSLVYRQVYENAILDAKLSDGTQSFLFRYGAQKQFEEDPDAVLAMLHKKAL